MTDIHGEYEQFNHILKNGSGSVRRKIDEEFGNTLSIRDKKSLATLIYYPREKLDMHGSLAEYRLGVCLMGEGHHFVRSRKDHIVFTHECLHTVWRESCPVCCARRDCPGSSLRM